LEQSEDTVIVSLDCFREMLHGKYRYSPKYEPIVMQLTFDAIKLALASKNNIIIDETLLSLDVTRRMLLVNLIKSYDSNIKVKFVSFKLDTNGNIERRMKEHRGLTKERWQRIYEELLVSYQPVQDSEPYDSIEYVDNFKQAE
jgi:hypothetical protein